MRGITKRYPGVVANDHIDLDVRRGEIHALLGENGAGKTTLMNVLYGLARPDEGRILLDGRPIQIAGPSDAIARGISMVHQHFMLVPVLSVAENVILGAETMANAVFVDRREAEQAHRGAGRPLRLRPRSGREGRLAVGRAAAAGRDPQGALPGRQDPRPRRADRGSDAQETEEIFALLRRLAADGRSIVFISHKLYEVLEVADRITVIRRGPGDRRAEAGGDDRGGARRADGRAARWS